MTSEPLVSVVLPAWNRADWVARAIRSVLGQTHRSVELIVVDDGSTDDTGRVAQSFGHAVTLLGQSHRGPYAARNLGVRHASGELIAFIDSDDAWYPDRLARQLALLGDPTVGLVFGDADRVDYRGGTPRRHARTAFQVTPPRRGWVTDHFAYGNFIPTSSVLVRRGCLEEAGEFCDSAQLSADYVMWFRISLRYRLEYVDGPVFEYAMHAGGISRDLLAALRSRIELFRAMLAQAPDRRARDALLHILFNLQLHLAFARLRRDRVVGALADGVRAFRIGSPGASVRWTAGFVGNQVRVRSRRRARKPPAAEAIGLRPPAP
jgi:glycosyltransferase involved in cell wall biosynthesis